MNSEAKKYLKVLSKKGMSSLLLLAGISIGGMLLNSSNAYADTTVLSAPPVVNVNGTDWVQVSTAAQLEYIDDYQSAYISANIELMNNIDLSGYSWWIPFGGIAYYPYDPAYSGTFNGQGYEITGLNIGGPTDHNVGFFGETTGTIENVGVDANVNVGINTDVHVFVDSTAGPGIGGLVGLQKGGTISNSYETGAVNGVGHIGALVGMQQSGGSIIDSYATGAVNGVGDTGGLVGEQWGSSIINSYATGAVSALGFTGQVSGVGSNSTGGLVGFQYGGTISNSYETGAVSALSEAGGLVGFQWGGSISHSWVTGSVSGGLTGGLVGMQQIGSISDSYETGSVSGSDAGGLVGLEQSGSSISDSYETGSVGGIGDDGDAGGLVDLQYDGTISNSYATGSVSAVGEAGGVVGYEAGNPETSVTNSYFDTTTTGMSQGFGHGSSGAFGEPTSAMTTESTFTSVGWDFTNTWGMSSSINNGYPYLRALYSSYIPKDTTPPTTQSNVSGTQGNNGWYTGPVQFSLSATDDTGVDATYYSTDGGSTWKTYSSPLSFSTDGKYTMEYYSVDTTGNKESAKSVSFNIDQTAPSSQSNVSGNQGNNGWYTGAVQLSLSATDAESGVATTFYSTDGGTTWQTYSSPLSFSSDGNYSIEYYSVDNAGNKEPPKNVSFNIDQTAPTTQSSVSGTQGKNGWYTGVVQLNLSATDNLSSVSATYYSTNGGTTWQTYSSPVSFSTDGKYNVEYYSVDNAGNKETAQSVNFNIDQAAPMISITSPTNGSYLDNQSLVVGYSVSDNLSGVDNATVTSTLDGQSISNGATIPLYTLKLGSHTFTVSGSDNAGNSATQTVTFQVGTSVDSLKNLVSLFTNNGSIDNAGASNALTAKLDSGSLQAFVNQVEAQSGKHISATVAQYLLRDAIYLLGQ